MRAVKTSERVLLKEAELFFCKQCTKVQYNLTKVQLKCTIVL